MSSYAEKLRDVRWQKKRLTVLDNHGWECDECGTCENELQVHHYWYESGLNPWEYDDKCYGVLCDSCHTQWHATKLEIDKLLAGLVSSNIEQAKGLLTGLNLVVDGHDFLVTKKTDPIFIAGMVRGFWPPNELQREILDRCLARIASISEFYFSEVVSEVTPLVHQYEFIHDWVNRVSVEVELGKD